MADLTGTDLAVNYQKTQPTTTMGTRNLAFFQVDMQQDVETNYLLPNSLYSKAIRGLQQSIELYGIGKPDNHWFTVIASAETAPFPSNRAAADQLRNSLLEDAINATTGLTSVRVWDGELVGYSIVNDC